MDESTVWKLIDVYFQENPQALVKHHVDSFNQFYDTQIFQLFKEMNPIKLEVDYDTELQEFRSKCLMYIGGKEGKLVYFGKPIIHDPNDNAHYMFPNECRLRDMTYSITIHYDVEIEYTRILRENDIPTVLDENGYAVFDELDSKDTTINGEIYKKDYTPSELAKIRENTKIQSKTQFIKMKLNKIYLGQFPIMVQSKLCVLHNLPRELRFSLGECKNDNGGYFIINGKEKVVIPQEEFGSNMLNIYKDNDEKYLYSVDLKSVSENVSKPVRHLSVKILASTKTISKNNIGVFIPNAGNKPIPLFVVFRALGILTDEEIISYCTLQDSSQLNVQFAPYLEACIHDAASITTQYEAVYFISLLVKGRSITRTMRILSDYFLPHVGEVNFLEKAYHLGYMVNRLMSVACGLEPTTDRDSYKCKRLTLIGPLMRDLFREYYKLQQKHIQKFFETRYEFGKDTYADLSNMINAKYQEAFSERKVEEGFRKAFKGNWGASAHTKIVGVVQDLNRLSHNGLISHLRKINLPMDSSVKLVAPRVLHGSQWGIIDPIDTPDGGNIGLHKHLSIMTHVTTFLSREPVIEWLCSNFSLKKLKNITPDRCGILTKVFVNGYWVGCVADPISTIKKVKLFRRQGLIPATISCAFDYLRNTITLQCDGGRLCRPIFYKDDDNRFVFDNKSQWDKIQKELTNPTNTNLWTKLISGFLEKSANFEIFSDKIYNWEDLYKSPKESINESKALLEYLDTQETESSLIAMKFDEITASNCKYTHCEIHPSTTYGVMCNLINFLEHNPASRNSFSCGQSKQACSLYSSNYQLRMDKTAVVLNNGQIPLVKSRYLQYINNEENPYGENAIVAIMCYTGYNVEDAVLINEGALQRGLFRTTYYTTYSAHEEKEIKNDTVTHDITFQNVLNLENIEGMKPDYDYSYLDENGLIAENTEIDDKIVLIGSSTLVDSATGKRKDSSKTPKKGQLGTVDKSFITEGDEGQRIAKIRIREERIPTFGDKFASRAGQKGTVGMVIAEENMPFTKDGIRPDMIINPHALPSRMTIGQMVECITGKACCMEGTAGECTSFYNRENKLGMFGELLSKHNFHSNGDEILYDGMTGKQLEASVFIGPTYYMRLKHMVKDKINHRATGPLTNLTRQPVSGRANDGGLRIGEMERDAVISHGMSSFLRESMMDRGDKYKLAICNKSGMIAIYNPSKDLLISPSADGPIKYTGSVEKDKEIEAIQYTKHGRDFSIVNVPYTLKLLIQELQGLNVQLRIITDDNINQIENMNFSKNLNLLVNKEKITIQEVIEDTQNILNQEKNEAKKDENETNDDMSPVEQLPSLSSSSENISLGKLMENDKKQYDRLDVAKYMQGKKDDTIEDSKINSNEDSYQSPYMPIDTTPVYIPSSDTSPIKYNSNSPQFNINDYSSNNSEAQYGGSNKIELNDKVLLKGDVKSKRLWKVTHKNDKTGMYTIDTDDLDLLSVKDSRDIVDKTRIRKPNVFDVETLEKTPSYMQEDNNEALEEEYAASTVVPRIPIPRMDTQQPVNIIKIFNQGGVDNSEGEKTATPNQYFDGNELDANYIPQNGNDNIENNYETIKKDIVIQKLDS